MQMILQKNGLAPNKDVTTLIIGAQEETVIALRTGRIAGALITPPRNFILQRDGFNRIAYSGITCRLMQTAGSASPTKK
jgi:ABC-type nitrate/sulfonate/bicarbonate transport system substrate-binding protein